MDSEEPGPDRFDVDFVVLVFSGGSLGRLVLSLGGGSGGGSGETLLLGARFVEVLLVLPLGIEEYVSVVGGGAGMTRPGPFVGKCGVPSLSAEE